MAGLKSSGLSFITDDLQSRISDALDLKIINISTSIGDQIHAEIIKFENDKYLTLYYNMENNSIGVYSEEFNIPTRSISVIENTIDEWQKIIVQLYNYIIDKLAYVLEKDTELKPESKPEPSLEPGPMPEEEQGEEMTESQETIASKSESGVEEVTEVIDDGRIKMAKNKPSSINLVVEEVDIKPPDEEDATFIMPLIQEEAVDLGKKDKKLKVVEDFAASSIGLLVMINIMDEYKHSSDIESIDINYKNVSDGKLEADLSITRSYKGIKGSYTIPIIVSKEGNGVSIEVGSEENHMKVVIPEFSDINNMIKSYGNSIGSITSLVSDINSRVYNELRDNYNASHKDDNSDSDSVDSLDYKEHSSFKSMEETGSKDDVYGKALAGITALSIPLSHFGYRYNNIKCELLSNTGSLDADAVVLRLIDEDKDDEINMIDILFMSSGSVLGVIVGDSITFECGNVEKIQDIYAVGKSLCEIIDIYREFRPEGCMKVSAAFDKQREQFVGELTNQLNYVPQISPEELKQVALEKHKKYALAYACADIGIGDENDCIKLAALAEIEAIADALGFEIVREGESFNFINTDNGQKIAEIKACEKYGSVVVNVSSGDNYRNSFTIAEPEQIERIAQAAILDCLTLFVEKLGASAEQRDQILDSVANTIKDIVQKHLSPEPVEIKWGTGFNMIATSDDPTLVIISVTGWDRDEDDYTMLTIRSESMGIDETINISGDITTGGSDWYTELSSVYDRIDNASSMITPAEAPAEVPLEEPGMEEIPLTKAQQGNVGMGEATASIKDERVAASPEMRDHIIDVVSDNIKDILAHYITDDPVEISPGTGFATVTVGGSPAVIVSVAGHEKGTFTPDDYSVLSITSPNLGIDETINIAGENPETWHNEVLAAYNNLRSAVQAVRPLAELEPEVVEPEAVPLEEPDMGETTAGIKQARDLDKTGPAGKGPMTGRGKGICVEEDKDKDKDKKKDKDKDKNKDKEKEAKEWTSKYKGDLPKGSYAYWDPKTKRGKLPYKNAAGKIDLAHVRNALSRLPQADIPEGEKARIKKMLRSHLPKDKK